MLQASLLQHELPSIIEAIHGKLIDSGDIKLQTKVIAPSLEGIYQSLRVFMGLDRHGWKLRLIVAQRQIKKRQ